ncbi:hypothetical protein [Paracoccus aminovorans]|uniref:hypothetical protein n=1 Tax=Paracoccus aminovorans TaxID=34004 RepID=UPI0039ECD819
MREPQSESSDHNGIAARSWRTGMALPQRMAQEIAELCRLGQPDRERVEALLASQRR